MSSAPPENRDPGPTLTGRGPGPTTLCGKEINFDDQRPCILRTAHAYRCVPAYAPESQHTPVVFVPSNGYRCCGCYQSIPYEDWAMLLADARSRYDTEFHLCRNCALEVTLATIAFPTAPAPDPEDWPRD